MVCYSNRPEYTGLVYQLRQKSLTEIHEDNDVCELQSVRRIRRCHRKFALTHDFLELCVDFDASNRELEEINQAERFFLTVTFCPQSIRMFRFLLFWVTNKACHHVFTYFSIVTASLNFTMIF